MKLEVLLSCMHQKDHSIVEKANLQTDALIINQADHVGKQEFSHLGSKIVFLTLDDRGVGLSRNNALMRSAADVVLFADEDISYVDDYETIVLNEFKNNPKADVLVFNVPSLNPLRPSAPISKYGRVRLYNCLKYGTVRMAVKLEKIRKHDIFFSLLFGGGARYSSGEDSRFIYNAIKSGLKVYAVPKTIAYVAQEDSSWFEGYNKKYFVDKGVLYRSLSPTLHAVFSLRFIILNRHKFFGEFTFWQLVRFMVIESGRA